MNVLSLFDGMSCGQIALNRIGINPTKYYASELDKYAIKVTQANYPDTIQLGDVTKWREWDIDWASIDLLIGGSPCQGFSFAGKQLAFDDPRSKLFFVYVDILNHIRSVNPEIKFMLENVRMKKEYLDVISEQLDVEPLLINSALLSAQNRQRYYWANWQFGQPEDRGIVLADIIEDGGEYNPAAIRGRYLVDGKRQDGKMLTAGLTQQMLEVKADQKTNALTTVQKDNVVTTLPPGRYPLTEKSQTILATLYKENAKSMVKRNKRGLLVCSETEDFGEYEADGLFYRKLTPVECERLQTIDDGYTAHVSNTQRYKMLGNGFTVDVIAHILKRVKECF